jgi:hypothetical protein
MAQTAAKLRWLLLDSQARVRFAERAQQNLEQLSVERVSGEYMAIYQQTLAERNSMQRRQMRLEARRTRAPDGAL